MEGRDGGDTGTTVGKFAPSWEFFKLETFTVNKEAADKAEADRLAKEAADK